MARVTLTCRYATCRTATNRGGQAAHRACAVNPDQPGCSSPAWLRVDPGHRIVEFRPGPDEHRHPVRGVTAIARRWVDRALRAGRHRASEASLSADRAWPQTVAVRTAAHERIDPRGICEVESERGVMRRAYRFCLLLYPRGHRDQFAEEMLDVFDEAS